MEPPVIVDRTQKPEAFYGLLPTDWQESLLPIWLEYAPSTKVYTLETKFEIVGGGLIFSKVTPDTFDYKDIAQGLYDKGYLYLAYIFVPEKHRRKNLGSVWLSEINKLMPGQKFWLAIEDHALRSFYEKNGFFYLQEIILAESKEWILVNKLP